ncbi:MAG: DUF4350 domain-containing protein [Opitutaceae bacterium]|nr:DUF4350 domain-containing protein [Opitutaceae bacterium]
MRHLSRSLGLAILAAAATCHAQQVADPDYATEVPSPAHKNAAGPCIAIDEAHHNFHTADGRYQPFAALLRSDGYRVQPATSPISAASLQGFAVLVIANARGKSSDHGQSAPTKSAFTSTEIATLHRWVDQGGSLFLIFDHMPFPEAAAELAKAFAIEVSNGFAVPKSAGVTANIEFDLAGSPAACAATLGRNESEHVSKVVTFVGSAFKPPADATVVLPLGGDFVSLLPERPWRFASNTPRVPLDGYCQGVIAKVGKGRIAVFGEAAMFTAQLSGPSAQPVGMNAPEATGNQQLLLNVVHWLTRLPGLPDC